MKTDINHLPPRKQRELERVKEILFEEFDDARALATQDWKKKGRIQHIILFGSYARGDWVDEPYTSKGYKSDYDLLVVVSHEKLTDHGTFWYEAKERLARDKEIKTPVNFLVHSLDQVNAALAEGQYFFTEIIDQGISLHAKPGIKFAKPKDLSQQERYLEARKHLSDALPHAKYHCVLAAKAIEDGKYRHAAFQLHQAVEHAYSAMLLVHTRYSPPIHNIRALRSLAEDLDKRLVPAWPRDRQQYRAWFNTLTEAYVKARYSEHYRIS